ncbi:MAG: thiamine-phosphate kinase [Gammaproteobacteria bacterium]|nr:MAG: thiamine-phosphate kinase [Gammaproteobacteria bacterium]RLA31564.1 MAG: thiamine-phosphate kinase [Gammaproteobacteria bacterium]
MDEFEIIRRYFERTVNDKSVRVGIGDDGAVLRPEPGRDLISVIDTLVSDVHFPSSLPPADIGYHAVAVNLSDIAAMAGRPRWMVLALTLKDSDPSWLASFSDGLFAAAEESGLALVGGDITHGRDTVISIQIIGDVGTDEVMTRSGANPGDAIYVTGTPGDASAGLAILQSGTPRNSDVDYLVRRFARPKARVDIGQAIAEHASAAIDLSDGLFTDIEKLLTASAVSGSIELSELPLSAQLIKLMDEDDTLRFALGGGDDYELCFTSSAGADVFQNIADQHEVPITCIGHVSEASDSANALLCTRNGDEYDYHHSGYRHFH